MPHVPNTIRGSRALHVRNALSGAALAAAVIAAAALLAPAPARADGDPASDVLLIENVFYSYAPPVSQPFQTALNTTISRAHAAGFPIKVALITGPLDLGAIPQLFGHPEQYAKFLDYEISYNTVPPLLVVMPHGFGTYPPSALPALAGIKIDSAAQSNGLARAAILAVARFAKHVGHPISIPTLPGGGGPAGEGGGGSSGGGSGFPWELLLVPVAAAVLVVLERRRRNRRRRALIE
jgi:hypothetical protein